MSFYKIIGFFLILLLVAGPAFSQQDQTSGENQAKEKEKREEGKKEAKTKLFQLDAIEIEVVEYLRDKKVPNMTVVKPEFFPMSIGTTLDTALERQPGVDVQRIQEVGTAVDDDSIKIRGMGARRIKVLNNGRLMNTSGVAGGYFIDWTMLPLTNVDRVEVIKGIGDPQYGNILGGIINLVPRRLSTEAPFTQIHLSGASFKTASLNLNHAYKPGAMEYSVAAGIGTSDGYLKNGDLSYGNAHFHLGYDFSFKGRVTADVTYSRLKKGFIVSNRVARNHEDPDYTTPVDSDFPASDGEYMYGGMGAYPEPGAWWEKRKWLFDLGYEQALGAAGVLSIRYWRNHGDREAYNTRRAAERVFHKTFFDDRSQGVSGKYMHFFSNHTISLGFDYSHLKDDGDKNLSDDFRSSFRNGYYVAAQNFAFFVMDEIQFLAGKLMLLPGVRFMSYKGISGPSGQFEQIPDISMDGWAPSLKLTYDLGMENLVYCSVSRALRMPTPPEHYWHFDFDDAGVNTSQLPFDKEDGLMLQAGWRGMLASRAKIEIAPYFYVINKFIQFDLINFVAYNIEKARLYGVEFEVTHRFGAGLSWFLNYTYQKSKTKGDPFIGIFVNPSDRDFAQIPGLPEHKLNLGVKYRAPNNASIAVFLQAVSSQEVVYNNNTLWNQDLRVFTQESYFKMDLEARYPLFQRVDLNLFVRNVFDASYQERFGFPAAGRNFGVALKADF